MSDYTNGIHKDFCNANYEPVLVQNVGELIEQLKRLPPGTKLDTEHSEFIRIVVYNASDIPEVSFEECDE
jgi:hypothetical protein